MNKYQITIDRTDNVGRLIRIPNNNSFNTGIENDNGVSNSTENATGRRQRAFFRHYENHSKQLVDALKQWSGQLHFINCEYSDGQLNRYNEEFIEPYVQFMSYMREHLRSGAYGENFVDPNSIQSRRKAICDEMEEIMVKDFGVPHSPSFNLLITNRIKTKCPQLASIVDADSDSNNFYLHKRIFSILFDVISGKRTLHLSTKKMSQDDYHYDLMYMNEMTIARGDESTISKLKTVLESLVEDENLQNHVKRYHELRAKLTSNMAFIELKTNVEKLHTCIQGGKLLGGFKSCALCIPDSLADVV